MFKRFLYEFSMQQGPLALALILSRKLLLLHQICVTLVSHEPKWLHNDTVGHFDYACCVSNVRFLLGKPYAKISTKTEWKRKCCEIMNYEKISFIHPTVILFQMKFLISFSKRKYDVGKTFNIIPIRLTNNIKSI